MGDFEYIEALTERTYSGKKIPVRIYTTKGLTQYAQFALRDACDALDFFSERFGVDYPLPKCDHLVVHEFISGAMENWGLITYKATKILFDPLTSDNRLMSKASYVIAHELAHQWFGNLVTMSGWTELWLNEGFATWAGFFAVDHLHPGKLILALPLASPTDICRMEYLGSVCGKHEGLSASPKIR